MVCRWSPLMVLVLVLGLLPDASAGPGRHDDPDLLAARAVAENPALKSIEHQILALKHRADSARVWADPMFAVEYSNIPWDSGTLGDSPMSGIQFKLQQTFPLPGKNDRRSEVVGAESRIKKWELEEQKLRLATTVKTAYWKLAMVRELRSLTRRHIELTGQLITTVRVKYQVGKVGQHNLLQLEVLKRKLEDDLLEFDRQEKELLAALNAALHRESGSQVKTPENIQAVGPDRQLEDLMAQARKHRPSLKGIQAQTDLHRLAADRAAYERWPDITVWAGYRIRTEAGMDPGSDFFTVGLAVPLPLDYTGRSDAQEEEHLVSARAAGESYRARLDQVRASLESHLASWSRAAQKVESYRKVLIPKADQTLKSTLSAYTSDRADFATLYQAELRLLEFDRAVVVAAGTSRIFRVRVEGETGAPWDGQRNGASK